MLTNFHTHSTYCDGKSTPEEIVLAALSKGFTSIGFSGHGHTPFDLRYCMQDTDGYISEIKRLQNEYKRDIQIYLGTEEDAFAPVCTERYDYIIGSCHYFHIGDKYYPFDSNVGLFTQCLELFRGDTLRMAEAYYATFCEYIKRRKPDIIGHFDYVTKFDEIGRPYFLGNDTYAQIADHYLTVAAGTGCIFEVNTGAIARGFRTAPYPSEDLLYHLKSLDAKLILSSDSHCSETLDFGFDDARHLLRGVGFQYVYTLYDHAFIKEYL